MYVYMHDCVIVSFLLLLGIGIGLPLISNFGRTFLCVYARACIAFLCVCVCVCVCVNVCVHRHVGMCVFCNRLS